MIGKSLASSCNLTFIKKKKILSCLFSFFFLFFFHQVIVKTKETSSTDFTTLTEIEKEYRKRFNLMDGSAEVGKECTLGKCSFILI